MLSCGYLSCSLCPAGFLTMFVGDWAVAAWSWACSRTPVGERGWGKPWSGWTGYTLLVYNMELGMQQIAAAGMPTQLRSCQHYKQGLPISCLLAIWWASREAFEGAAHATQHAKMRCGGMYAAHRWDNGAQQHSQCVRCTHNDTGFWMLVDMGGREHHLIGLQLIHCNPRLCICWLACSQCWATAACAFAAGYHVALMTAGTHESSECKDDIMWQ